MNFETNGFQKNTEIKDVKASNENMENKIDPDKRIEGEKVPETLQKTFDPDSRVEVKETSETLFHDYISDLKELLPSDKLGGLLENVKLKDFCPNTPEVNKAFRNEFKNKRERLISEWETNTGMKWPTYEKDVIGKNGQILRHAGEKYDAHHIIPVCLGGKNEAENLVPIHVNEHYDRTGVHSKNSPLSRLGSALGGV